MNIVFIMTDTQNKSMVGAYGNVAARTPNLDRLAREGIRFDRAYTACPLCTPARGAIFTGQHPQVNGAWCNNVAPHSHVPLMGEIFRNAGYRAAYTGKWHLDGAGYFGDGIPGGGFEPDWWYDGKRYADDMGERFKYYKNCRSADDLRKHGFTLENIWGHRVAGRAVDFLERVEDEDFILAVSFDEPHGPFVTPPEYWENWSADDIARPDNFMASLDGKPELQKHFRKAYGEASWETFVEGRIRHFACNNYIDTEIGRVIDAVDKLHAGDTIIIYTTDHGDMRGSHGLRGKGAMMYEEITNVPFIARVPGGPAGATSKALVSHVDILPTMLDYTGQESAESLQGVSLRPVLEDPDVSVRDTALISFGRFAINHDTHGEFYPIRCLTDGRYKLVLNLLDTDELYDIEINPLETENRIDDPACAEVRNALHTRLIEQMDAIRDPFRCWQWACRPWNRVREPFETAGKNRITPAGFPFQPDVVAW